MRPPAASPVAWRPTTLEHCLLLAALLHLWLVLALGSAPAGTALPGLGVWGAINITLRGPAAGPAAVVAPPPAPVIPLGPVGEAAALRWGGAVRERRVEPPESPGAAQLGTWADQPPPLRQTPPLAREPAAAPLPELAPIEVPVPPPPPGRVVQERAAAPTAVDPAPAAAPPAERLLDATRVQPARSAAAAAPLTGTALLSNATLPPLPTALAPALAPVLTPLQVPAAAPLAAPPAPPLAEAAPPPPVLRQFGAAAPAAARSTAPAANLARDEPLAPVLAPPGLPAPPTAVAATPGPRTPDAGPQLGHDVATAPSLPASAAPRLKLELPRLRGGELSRYSSTGVLPVLPRPPELPDKLGSEIQKAAKADCREAYGALGILAVVPLAVDAVRKDGCKW